MKAGQPDANTQKRPPLPSSSPEIAASMTSTLPIAPDTLTPQAEARLMEFTRSELFAKTFRQGMDMVEETAAYLDGPGRQDSKKLSRNDALTYASQSMRLTTRLMQVASWLLVQRL